MNEFENNPFENDETCETTIFSQSDDYYDEDETYSTYKEFDLFETNVNF